MRVIVTEKGERPLSIYENVEHLVYHQGDRIYMQFWDKSERIIDNIVKTVVYGEQEQ